MDTQFVITTNNGNYNCCKIGMENEGRHWSVQFKQLNGATGVLRLPDDWGPTRIVQFLEGLDKVV